MLMRDGPAVWIRCYLLKTFVIIGGGAAGCFAAVQSARNYPNNRYIVLEATKKPLTKVRISGGGRCNVTHNCFEPRELIKNYPRGSKELIGNLTRFGPRETIEWFREFKVELHAESDGRMFPTTNQSATVVQCLLDKLAAYGVNLRLGCRVRAITACAQGFQIELQDGSNLEADGVLLATGSSPEGHRLAESLGHRITPLAPSLFTFKISDPFLVDLAGQSVPNARVRLRVGSHHWERVGPVLITHWGLSGPAILKLSAFAARELYDSGYHGDLTVNWLGDATDQDVFDQLWHHAAGHPRKMIETDALFGLSRRLWQRFCQHSGLAGKTWADGSKKTMRSLSQLLVAIPLSVSGKGIFKEEFVTCGGVDRREIDFPRMASRLVPGLFFAGEITDVDGITGGFNFQNAWTGAWLVSQSFG